MAFINPQTPDAVNSNSVPVKPDTIGIVLASDTQTENWHLHESDNTYDTSAMTTLETSFDQPQFHTYHQEWNYISGGFEKQNGDGTSIYGWLDDDGVTWHTEPNPSSCGSYDLFLPIYSPYSSGIHMPTNVDCDDTMNVGNDHCDVSTNYPPIISVDDPDASWWSTNVVTRDYSRSSQTKYLLVSGGRAIPGRWILHDISASARSVLPYLDIQSAPHPNTSQYNQLDNYPQAAIPPTEIHIAGGKLYADGHLWKAIPAGAGVMDATPTVDKNKFYVFDAHDSPHLLFVTAGGQPLDSQPVPDFCVGQYVTFELNGIPSGGVTAAGLSWSLGGHYFNDETQADENASSDPFVDESQLFGFSTTAWWVQTAAMNTYNASISFTLNFTNGQPSIPLNIGGPFNMWRPMVTLLVNPPVPNMTITSGEIGVDDNYLDADKVQQFALHYGENYWHFDVLQGTGTANVGVTFYRMISMPTTLAGMSHSDNFLQVVDSDYRSRNGIGRSVSDVLDKDPYPDTIIPNFTDDSPALYGNEDTDSELVGNFHATMYVMFTPADGHRVPLMKDVWSWEGTAEKSGTWWSLTDSGSSPGTPAPTEDYPTWTNSIANITGF